MILVKIKRIFGKYYFCDFNVSFVKHLDISPICSPETWVSSFCGNLYNSFLIHLQMAITSLVSILRRLITKIKKSRNSCLQAAVDPPGPFNIVKLKILNSLHMTYLSLGKEFVDELAWASCICFFITLKSISHNVAFASHVNKCRSNLPYLPSLSTENFEFWY